MLPQLKTFSLSLICLLIIGCASDQYVAKPLDTNISKAKILAKDPISNEFTTYLLQQGYKKEALPFKSWGLDELTMSALFHHTKLDVAKAQLALAKAAINTAGIKQRPIISGNIARSDQANGDIRPWAYGLNVEIPIATSNKRTIRIEEAQRLADASRMDVADIAWQLRSTIAEDLLAYHQNTTNIALLRKMLATQTSIADMLQKRIDHGIAPKATLSTVKLGILNTASELSIAQAGTVKIKTRLAADIGLTIGKFAPLLIKPLNIDQTLAKQAKLLDKPLQSKTLQEKALLNRIDIRRSMHQYLAAEARIKLEIAKQTPDITINPGFVFDFGDKIWSLGFSSLLNLLNKNQTLIAKSTQLRALEGAKFEHLQAKIIANIAQQYANYNAAKQVANEAQTRYLAQLKFNQNLQKQFDAGIIGRLELNRASLNSIKTDIQVNQAKFSLLQSMHQIENELQAPLYNEFIMPN